MLVSEVDLKDCFNGDPTRFHNVKAIWLTPDRVKQLFFLELNFRDCAVEMLDFFDGPVLDEW